MWCTFYIFMDENDNWKTISESNPVILGSKQVEQLNSKIQSMAEVQWL